MTLEKHRAQAVTRPKAADATVLDALAQVQGVTPPSLPAETPVEQQFRHAYERLFWPFVRVARRWVGDRLAEDVVQQVFFKFWNARQRLTPEKLSDKAIATAVCRHAIDVAERERTMDQWPDESVRQIAIPLREQPDVDHEIEDVYEWALEQLPRRRREVFVMTKELGLTINETAAVLKIGPESVKTHVKLGLRMMRELLTTAEYLPPPPKSANALPSTTEASDE